MREGIPTQEITPIEEQEGVEYIPQLEQHGLDGELFLSIWEKNKGDEHSFYERNMEMIDEMEKEEPGSVSFLNKKYGVFNFSRYPIEILLDQYRSHGDTGTPYGIVLYPLEDNHGAFSKKEDELIFRDIYNQMDGQFKIKILESSGKRDILKKLVNLKNFFNKEGNGHKISFAIIGGHGDKSSIKFGSRDSSDGVFNIEDLEDQSIINIRESIFEPHPTFVLNSCETGIESGMADRLKSKFNAEVFAPKEKTIIEDIDVVIENGAIRFDVQYVDNFS